MRVVLGVRMLTRVAAAVVLLAALAAGAAWLWFRYEAKSWAWWDPPAVLTIHGRHYDHGHQPPVSLTVARSSGTGVWTHVATEWPMRWSVWAAKLSGSDPTVVYLCKSKSHCIDYTLRGGP